MSGMRIVMSHLRVIMHVSYVSHHALSELSCTSLTVVPYCTGIINPDYVSTLYLNSCDLRTACNVWDAYTGSAIPTTTTAVPFYYSCF